jgi:hypothetical protein
MNSYFCHRCGKKLIETELPNVPWYLKMLGGKEFNSYTGERNIARNFKCPSKEPWWSFATHTDYTVMRKDY